MMSEERPIIFQGDMVRAILDGRKTQTRRIVKPAPYDNCQRIIQHGDEWLQVLLNGEDHELTLGDVSKRLKCPHGVPGDRLWVRETFSRSANGDGIWYWADGNPDYGDWSRPKPSIHMPRWASRITLQITDIRVEQLCDISEEDAIAEGVSNQCEDGMWISAMEQYADLWDSINGGGSWDANPWVWVIEFVRMQP